MKLFVQATILGVSIHMMYIIMGIAVLSNNQSATIWGCATYFITSVSLLWLVIQGIKYER